MLKPDRPERFIAVMGPTGVGKSTFISYATKHSYQGAGHNLRSCTAEIVSMKSVSRDNQPVVFIDTPGFDDTYKTDIEILSMIAEFLVKARNEQINLDTILYLHRISDDRMAGSPLRNLELFASLCGKNAMPRVVLVTTMWEHVTPEVGERRENELKSDFWRDMIAKGCIVRRFGDSYESAWDILASAIESSQVNVLLSAEIAEQHRKLKETEAGQTLNKQLQKLIKEQKEANRKLKELASRQRDGKEAQEVLKRAAELDDKIRRAAEQMRELRLPLPKHLLLKIFRSSSTGSLSLAPLLKDRVVVIMGVHGAGKTTFINYATGQLDKKVGNGLHADTRDIEFTKADSPNGQSVVLVDTPGFDSSTEPPVETLTQIAEHLNKAYKKEIKIDTILYLHKISDNRMAGSVRESLKFFSTLCNQEEPPNVIFVTTMWGHVSDEIGDRREEQLKNLFWSDIITDDSQVKRFKDTYESALEILGYSPDDIKSPVPASEQNNDQKSRWTLSFSRLVLKARVRAAFQ